MTTLLADVPVLDDDPYSDENLADPYPMFARMREAGPAVWLEKYGVHVFARFEECRQILVDHETFISGAGVGPRNFHHEPPWRPQGILDSDPPIHTTMRTAMASVITPRNVRSLRAQFTEFAEQLVDEVVRARRFDAVTDFAQVFPIRAFGDAVGIPRDGRAENLIPHGAMNFSAFGPEDDRYRQYFEAGQPTVDWVMTNCSRENLSPGGLGAQLWGQADAGVITPEQATLLVRALLSAGLDTTMLAIGNTLHCLAANPAQWQEVADKPTLARFAIDEALRLESPFQSFFRTTSRPVDIAGVHLPADTKVLLFMGSANRDVAKWGAEADRYLVTRNAGGHLAFGMGIHQCVGQPISRLEMEVLFTTLAQRVQSIRLAGEPVPFLHNTLRGWSSLPVEVVPR